MEIVKEKYHSLHAISKGVLIFFIFILALVLIGLFIPSDPLEVSRLSSKLNDKKSKYKQLEEENKQLQEQIDFLKEGNNE